MFDKNKIRISDDCFLGKSFVVTEETDSTNSDAKRNCNMEEGTVFLAERQTAGRGRSGRKWESESGLGIWMSILLKPSAGTENVSSITLVAGLAICRVFRKLGVDAYIKWPNDIVVNGKKICGILVESLISGNEISVVAGIGINANHSSFEEELKDKATSYFIEKKEVCNREYLVGLLLESFDGYYRQFINNGFGSISEEYKKLCITLGKRVRVVNADSDYEAEAVDITTDGELIINKNGEKIILNSGEVSVRGIYGYV